MEKIDAIENEVRELILEVLNLEDLTKEDIQSNTPLFGEGVGLDSIDGLELGMAIKEKYNLNLDIEKDMKEHFFSINSIALFIVTNS